MTLSSETSRAEPTWSRAREGRGIGIVPEIEFRPETETRPEPEIQVSMSAICEEGVGATGPSISNTASQYVTAERLLLHSLLVRTLEIGPNLSTASQTVPSHTTGIVKIVIQLSACVTRDEDNYLLASVFFVILHSV